MDWVAPPPWNTQLEILVKDGQMMEYDQPLFVLGD